MRLAGNRSTGSRLTTSILAAIIGVGAGFVLGMTAALVLTTLLEPHITTDGEGWEIIIIWIAGAFGGAAIGGLVGLVVGFRRRPAPATPPRPDAGLEPQRAAP
jgi:hypothetical protein